jgi:hypothetical protein
VNYTTVPSQSETPLFFQRMKWYEWWIGLEIMASGLRNTKKFEYSK